MHVTKLCYLRCLRRLVVCFNGISDRVPHLLHRLGSPPLRQSHCLNMGMIPDATPEQIKKTYYNFMKSCHLDLSGNDADTTNFCMFINEVYTISFQVLSDLVQRMVYDEIHGYALTATKPFLDDSYPKDHVLYLTDVVILL
ncbi:hypothetical protein AgCh_034853 [Apium graveolens]